MDKTRVKNFFMVVLFSFDGFGDKYKTIKLYFGSLNT